MVTLETVQANSRSIEPTNSSPRISFSAEFLDDTNFISISPNSPGKREAIEDGDQKALTPPQLQRNAAEFEFLSSSSLSSHSMITADELFFEGKLLPFWQMQQAEKLSKISLKTKDSENELEEPSKEESSISTNSRVNWFVDDDPSPRPPKCTVLWKELLRLKKQRASTLSPSSSSSSSSSSASSLADIASADEGSGSRGNKDGLRHREKLVKGGVRRGLERTRSATIRIRPMINVPICTQVKTSSALPPLFPLKKGKLER
ncbi:hypothetical protein TIFTF001_015827 [Ficus carica]|uniref:Uncharacterized protein n=1 Tax=Ficus carica TaxID=3494 RepID=A0AA88A560_FICCA|nr:hypothetical protein TIFTF001_015827 [Ficus carica]